MNKPETPLPWWSNTSSIIPRIFGPEHGLRGNADQVPANGKDAAYIVHACNAYPRLVEALRNAVADADRAQQGQWISRFH